LRICCVCAYWLNALVNLFTDASSSWGEKPMAWISKWMFSWYSSSFVWMRNHSLFLEVNEIFSRNN
jgi:apolipoprotein N-acyltransferase